MTAVLPSNIAPIGFSCRHNAFQTIPKFHFPCPKDKSSASLFLQPKKCNLQRSFTEEFGHSFPMPETQIICISILTIHEVKGFFLKSFCTKLAAFPFHFSQNQNTSPIGKQFAHKIFHKNQRCKTMRHKFAHKFAHKIAHKISHRICY